MSVCPDCGKETVSKNLQKLCVSCAKERKRISNLKSKKRSKRKKSLNLKGKSFDEVRELIRSKYEGLR